MRNTITLTALAAGASLALAACSTGAPSDDGTAPAAGGDGNKEIAFVQGVAGDEFYITMECGIKEKAAELGYTVTTQGPQKFDPTLQKPIVDSVTASEAGGPPRGTDGRRGHAGAPRAGRATPASRSSSSTRRSTTRRSPSRRSARTTSAGARRPSTPSRRPSPAAARCSSSRPTRASPRSTPASRASRTPSKADTAFSYLGVQYSHNDPATAANLVSAALQKDPDIVGIFATNLFAAEGSATGVRQAGAEDITIVGFDAGPNQIKALEAGTVQALVAQQPSTIGSDGVEQADAALKGGSVTPTIQTGFTIITKENLSGEGGDAAYKSSC